MSSEPFGTALRESDITEGKVICIEDRPELKYKWAAGVAIGRFLQGLKKGKLLGRRCRKCRRVLLPPRMFCELCFRPTDEWVELKDTGTINTFARCYIATDASRLKDPLVPAVIEIDGASKGMGILHLVGGVESEKVRIGMRVRARWKSPEKRKGDITDIEYFEPYE